MLIELALLFGLGLLGAGTLFWTVRRARNLGQTILFGGIGIAFLLGQCALVKFITRFGAAFGGEHESGIVFGCVAFSVMAVILFVAASINKFSNGK